MAKALSSRVGAAVQMRSAIISSPLEKHTASLIFLHGSGTVILTVSGFFAPLSVRPWFFCPWLICPLADTPSGLFAPWLVRPLPCLPPGWFAASLWTIRPRWIKVYIYLGVHQAVIRPRPCLLYTSPSPRDRQKSRMPSSAWKKKKKKK